MATINLTQTDTTIDHTEEQNQAPYAWASTNGDSRECDDGAGAGSVEFDAGADSNQVDESFLIWESADNPNESEWAAGEWTIRINITTSRSGVWRAVTVAERLGDGSFFELAEDNDLGGPSLSSTGVKTFAVTQSDARVPDGAGSRVYIICGMNSPSHGGTEIGVTPNQDNDTPIEAVAGGETVESTLADIFTLTDSNLRDLILIR